MISEARLISKFMAWQLDHQTISIYCLSSWEVKATKQGNMANWNMEMFFFKNHEENEIRRLLQDLIYFLKRLYMRREQLGEAYIQYILRALNLAYNKIKLYRTLDHWSRDMLNFDFLEKSLGIGSPAHLENASLVIFY